MDEFPPADDMYEQTKRAEKNIISDTTLETLSKLLPLIEKNSEKGKYTVSTDLVLSKDVRRALKSKGYKVIGGNGAYCEEAVWDISWENIDKVTKNERNKKRTKLCERPPVLWDLEYP